MTQCRSRRSDVEGADEEFVNSREELLTKGFVCTVVLIKEYGSGGVGILEESDFCYGGFDGDIWCCARILWRDERSD